jgi:hypothetical protein
VDHITYFEGDEVIDEMGGASSTQCKDKKCRENCSLKTSRERERLEDPGVNGSMMLKFLQYPSQIISY